MKKKNVLAILCLLQIILFSPVMSDNTSQITVSISKMNGYIGEPFEISLILKSQVQLDEFKVEIDKDNFELVSKKNIKTEKNTSYILLGKKLKIIFWETGNFKIKPIKVMAIKDDKIIETLYTNALDVTISSVLKKGKDTKKDLKPLKPLAKVIGTIMYFLKYLFFAILIISLIILIVVYLKKRTREKHIAPKLTRTPIEEFEFNYKKLKKRALIVSGKLKFHFLNLTEISKKFLHREYNFNAEDLTTFETIMALKNIEENNLIIKHFNDLLEFSDKVKFAKFIPETEDIESLDKIVDEISVIFIEKQKQAERERIEKTNAKKNN